MAHKQIKERKTAHREGLEVANASLHLRVSPDELESYHEAAQADGLSMSLWVRRTLNRRARRK